MLKIVNKNNKDSYRVVQETHLDEHCVIDSQMNETLESTDVVKDLPIRLGKISMTILQTWQMNADCSKLKCSNN